MFSRILNRQPSHRSIRQQLRIETLQLRYLMAADLMVAEPVAEVAEATVDEIDTWFVSNANLNSLKDDAQDAHEGETEEDRIVARLLREAGEHEERERELREQYDDVEEDQRLEISRQIRQEIEEVIKKYKDAAEIYDAQDSKEAAAENYENAGDALKRLVDELKRSGELGEDVREEVKDALVAAARAYRQAANQHDGLEDEDNKVHAERLRDAADECEEAAEEFGFRPGSRWGR